MNKHDFEASLTLLDFEKTTSTYNNPRTWICENGGVIHIYEKPKFVIVIPYHKQFDEYKSALDYIVNGQSNG